MLLMKEWLSVFENERKLKIYIWCTPKISQVIGLDVAHQIHDSALCRYIKSSGKGLQNCIRNRECVDKICERRGAFSGHCANGIYEFVYPVYYKEKYIATIYISNLMLDSIIAKQRITAACRKYGLDEDYALELLTSTETVKNATYYKTLSRAVAECMVTILNSIPSIPDASIPNLVLMLRDNIHAHYDSSSTLNCIAKEYHVHEKYLGKLFKKNMGYNFVEYRNKIRLQKASELLINSKLKVIDISVSVGYENITYFNRIFKRQYAMSPLEFRHHNSQKK